MRLILLENKLDIKTSEEEKFEFVIKAAKGELKFEDIRLWIRNHLK